MTAAVASCRCSVITWDSSRAALEFCPMHAAAQELLVAAQCAVLYFQRDHESPVWEASVMTALERAIQKAEGVSTREPDAPHRRRIV